jgi:hypothetical protein
MAYLGNCITMESSKMVKFLGFPVSSLSERSRREAAKLPHFFHYEKRYLDCVARLLSRVFVLHFERV